MYMNSSFLIIVMSLYGPLSIFIHMHIGDIAKCKMYTYFGWCIIVIKYFFEFQVT